MTTVEKIAMAVNPYDVAMRTVTININNRCPVKCRQCSVGFSDDQLGTGYRVGAENLQRTIAAINPSIYDMVLLAGGEPSLDPELLQVAIEACRARGLLSAAVTAPIWAKSAASAASFLKRVADLNILILSYDRYHLDFLTLAHYNTAVRSASDFNIFVQIEIAFTEESEKRGLIGEIAHLAHLLNIHANRAVPVGNASDPLKFLMHRVSFHGVADLQHVPRSCVLGDVHIDEQASLHGCCWSRTVCHSPFSIIGGREWLVASLGALERNRCSQEMREHGFINGLNDRGREALAVRFAGKSIANECELCIAPMQSRDDGIWGQYRKPTWGADD